MGKGNYRALCEPVQYCDQDIQQVRQVFFFFLWAWRHIAPTGQVQTSFIKTLQGATEPYTNFLARLHTAVIRAVGQDKIAKVLLQILAFENANPECKCILVPLKGQNASLGEYVRACAGVGGIEHQDSVFAATMS